MSLKSLQKSEANTFTYDKMQRIFMDGQGPMV